LPAFISLETECLGEEVRLTEAGSIETLNLLRETGYTQFKLIYQSDFSAVLPARRRRARPQTGKHSWQFRAGDSGLWGDETPGPWLSYQDARTALRYEVDSGVDSWHDWHAKP
jgi:hypothetical protein